MKQHVSLRGAACALAQAAALIMPVGLAGADGTKAVDLDRLGRTLADCIEIELRGKVLSELLSATNIPPAVAQIAFTNLVSNFNGLHFELEIMTHCARFMSNRDVLSSISPRGANSDLLCCVIARLPESRTELQPDLERFARSRRPDDETGTHILLSALQRSTTGHEDYILRGLRGDDALRESTIRALERCGLGEGISLKIGEELLRVVLKDPDNLWFVASIFGQMGSNALPLANGLEKAWREQRTKTGPAAYRDMIVETALAKVRDRWKRATARRILKEAGTDLGDDSDRAKWFVMDIICWRLLTEADQGPVFGLLADKNPRVVLGAARFCYLSGARARSAEGALWAALKQSKDEEVRHEILRAIAMVGNRRTAVKLDEFRRLAVSGEECQAIDCGVRLIAQTASILGPLYP